MQSFYNFTSNIVIQFKRVYVCVQSEVCTVESVQS